MKKMIFPIESPRINIMEIMKYMDFFSIIVHCWNVTKAEIFRSAAKILHCMKFVVGFVCLFLLLPLLPMVFNIFIEQQDSFPGEKCTRYILTIRL